MTRLREDADEVQPHLAGDVSEDAGARLPVRFGTWYSGAARNFAFYFNSVFLAMSILPAGCR